MRDLRSSHVQAGEMHGDVDFETLVRDHYAGLYRFALSMTHHEADACDLVQETFYLWATRGHQLKNPTKVRSWLFTTLHRELLGRQRRLARFPHQEISEVQGELPEVPPELPGAVDAGILLQALDRLDPDFRGAVTLFYLEDCTYSEIAGILDIPLGTVKSRIARAMAQLQRLLKDSEMEREQRLAKS